ncbi:hypothetical protein COK41_29055 [Bacillus cereus]|nr:hypothetical protein COK41_29055 [Bacillus cereus]
MREIKFRAWDKVYKHFHEGDLIRDYNIGEFIDNPEYEVTQYTGLNDKNGKEIYEGDILSRHDGGIHFQEESLAEHVVKWGEFGWVPFNIGIGKSRCVYGEIFDFIVIGNIYENPEFL